MLSNRSWGNVVKLSGPIACLVAAFAGVIAPLSADAQSGSLVGLYYDVNASAFAGGQNGNFPGALSGIQANLGPLTPNLIVPDTTSLNFNAGGNGNGFPGTWSGNGNGNGNYGGTGGGSGPVFTSYYSGMIDIGAGNDGTYTFSTQSDDGSMLFIDALRS